MEAKTDADTHSQICLTDKPSFDHILHHLQPETSDLTFTNFFMWQHSYGLRPIYLPDLDYWVLFAKPPNRWRPFFLPPVGDWNNPDKLKKVLDYMDRLAKSEGVALWLRRFPGQLSQALHDIDPTIVFTEDPRTFDYIYQAQDLIKLEGRKYHSKRNHLHQFSRKYSWEYQRITQRVVEECCSFSTEWFDIKEVFHRVCTDEQKAMAMVMNNYDALGVCGGVIKVDGQIQAIAVGEKLRDDMAVIHIEKANIEYEGIYAAINQQFATDFGAPFQYINREEDMGIEGLRKAKLSYHPARLVMKFNGERK